MCRLGTAYLQIARVFPLNSLWPLHSLLDFKQPLNPEIEWTSHSSFVYLVGTKEEREREVCSHNPSVPGSSPGGPTNRFKEIEFTAFATELDPREPRRMRALQQIPLSRCEHFQRNANTSLRLSTDNVSRSLVTLL